MDKAAKHAKFEEAWARIREELVEHVAIPAEAIEWYGKNLDYNVPGGKLNRGMPVVDSAEIFKGAALDDDEYHKAAVLGWCVELLQAFFLVADDIMDSSITRWGQPCWYRSTGVGMIAINDGTSYYVDLLEIFHETTFQTEMGQLIDLITADENHVDLGKFSLEKHRLIVIYRTAYYSFYLPVVLAMHVAGVPASYTLDEKTEPYKVALSILLPLGEYFQIQDDFLDFSAPSELLGKIGTDIVDNKCSWCINTAPKLATPKQRAVLYENCGKKDSGGGAREEGRLCDMIAAIPEGSEPGTLKRKTFSSFLEKMYNWCAAR
ncbi:isoprenoid synthase domain-containing protein [Mycena leptocephala]|nr:isoprenoid synthase domain-containing protein [Mycena leptocephala]